MTSVRGIVRDQLTQDTLNCSMMAMEDEGPSLVFCNLPPRHSESEFEPSRMSYYNGNEHLSVPFKWEAAPGTPIVDHSSQAVVGGHQESGRLQLRPPPSASNSPLNPVVPASFKDQQKSGLPPKSRSYSRPEFTYSMSSRSSRSSSTTTADSSCAHQRSRSKGSMSRRSDFDWPEVSDDEYSSPRATDDQEPPASSSSTTMTGKQWSLESTSFSSTSISSQTPSPVSSGSGVGPRAASGSTRDLFALRNLVNFAAVSAVAPANSGGRSESTEGSEDGESESSETDDHVRPLGFLSCMPIFSRVRMIQSTFRTSDKQTQAVINFSKRLTPGSRNKGYRPNYRQSL